MQETKLQIIIDAKDRASKIVREIDNKFNKLSKRTVSLKRALLGLGLSFGGLTLFVKNSIEKFGIQERAQARLAAGLSNVQNVTDETMKSLTGYASELQRVTTFGDETIISTMGMLSTFQLNEQQIKELTPRILDMTAALEKSNGTQQDMEAVSIAVGKAMTLGVGSLTRYGVVINDADKEAFQFADTQEKLNIITRNLDANFKGVAEAVGQTATGSMKRFKNMMGDIMEQIGRGVAGPMSDLLSILGAQSTGFTRVGKTALTTFKIIRNIYEGFTQLTSSLGQFTLGLEAYGNRQNRVLSWITEKIFGMSDSGQKKLNELDKEFELIGLTSLALDENISGLVERMNELETQLEKEQGSWMGLNGVLGQTAESYNDLAESASDSADKMINEVERMQARFLGLGDEETSAFRKIISLQKEKLKTEGISLQDRLKARQEILLAEQEINRIIIQRKIPTVGETVSQAGQVRSGLSGLGFNDQMQRFISPLSEASNKIISTYNFNFSNATITDKEQLIREIKGVMDRESELKNLGGT